MKKALKITGLVFLSLILLAFIIPIAFKKQITQLIKKEINKSLTAKVDFADVHLSLLRHFPRVTIVLKDLSIVGTDEFEGDTLIYAKKVDASANLLSVIKGKNIKIFGAYLKSPRIHALMNKEGKVNWDIAKKSTDTTRVDTSASAFRMSLKNYSISDGYIEYKDDKHNTHTVWDHVDHRGSGDLTLDQFTLSTVTHAREASFTQDDIPYLANSKADIVTDIKIDNKTNTYTFNTDRIILNDLKLSLQGFFQLVNDSTYNMDVKFNSPSNQFRNILSMIPAIYKKDFEKLNTSGDAVFNGFVKGTYSPTQFPAYDVNLEVKNGSFKYPELPKPVKNVQLALHATNPDGLPDNAVIDISKGHLEMDQEPFDFKLLLKNPETARYIDAAAKGKLDLSQVSQFIKLPHDTKMSGLVWADAWAKGNMSAMEKLQGPFNAGGFFNIRDLFYSSKDFPEPIRNGNMNVSLENSGGIADKTMIHVTSAHMEVGNDPVDFSLQLSNPVSTVNFNGSAKGRFTLDNAKQFTKFDPGTSVSGVLNADVQFAGNKKIINDGEYDKMNILGSASLNNVKYVTRDYPTGIVVNNVSADFAPSNVNIREFSGHYLGSGFSGNGSLNNLISFIVKNAPLSGMVNASLDKMNLNEWIGKTTTSESTTSSSANARPFLVPVNMNVSVNAKAGQVSYDKVDYDNINGNLLISNETVKLDNIRANALDGTIMLNGSYSTRLNKVKPDISLNYDIEDMDVQKVFYAFNPIQFIMPIGKFLSGKLSSALSMTGNLKGDMMPDLKSLTGKGNLLLLKGVLKQFAPLEKLAMVLQIDRLKSITLQDIKNYFEFANGRVLIKPFTIKIDSIEMLISGFHGFDQSIDYAIQMKLPRRVMGTKGNDLITGLAASANSSGIPLKLGEMINLDIKMSGTLTNPYIGINLKGMVDDVVKDMAQQAKDFLQAKMDSLKQKAKDSLAATLKNQLEDNLKNKLKNQFFGKDTSLPNNNPTDTSQQKEPIINNLLKNLLNRNKKPKDSTHNQ